jgi:predicted RNA-binding protein with PUA-like domain
MRYWLVKSEPGEWSWDDHVRKGVEPWTGVRNHQAAGHLRTMKRGDRAFFYHSVNEKQIVGILQVVREAYPDPTDPTGKFVAVDFKAVEPVKQPVTLAQIKAEPTLADLPLIRQSRLSVMPIPAAAWRKIRTMAGLK